MRAQVWGLVFGCVATLLSACGGGGGDGVGSPKEAAQGNAVVTAAFAPSNHYVEVSFSQPVGTDAAQADNYKITSKDGASLTVKSATLTANGTRALIVTDAQKPMLYTLRYEVGGANKVSSVTDSSLRALARLSPISTAIAAIDPVSFTGSSTLEPLLLTAIAISGSQVLLTFDKELDAATAEQKEFYEISNPNLHILSASLSNEPLGLAADLSTVLLTTDAQENTQYTVKVANVKSTLGRLINPFWNMATFNGKADGSVTAKGNPAVVDAHAVSNTSVLVSFDRPMADGTENPSNYQICADNANPCTQLVITGGALSQYKTQVLLTTLPQLPGVSYTLSVLKAMDTMGNAMDPAKNSLSFTYDSAVSGTGTANATTRPVVLGANSLSNRSVIVSFSKVMGASAEDPLNYAVAQQNVTSEAGRLYVKSATLLPDRTAVKLTTSAQSEVVYRVKAVNVKDEYGNPLAEPKIGSGVILDPSTALFSGTPSTMESLTLVDSAEFVDDNGNGKPDAGEYVDNGDLVIALEDNDKDGVIDNWVDSNANGKLDAGDVVFGLNDTDQDGLTDNEELRGYEVSYITYNNETVKQQVTSDPELKDTDGDGVSDADEKHYRTNPRDADTDDDQLTDYQELNETYTDPFKQDSDGDALTDGLEFNFFHTSPLFADTDGDQLQDFDEIVAYRNPRVADLPQLDIEVGDVNLQLDYRFDVTKEGTTTRGQTQTASSTLTQGKSTEFSKSSSESHSFDVKLGFAQSLKFKATDLVPEWKMELSQELSTNNSWSSSVSRASSESSTKEYAKSLESNVAVTQGETVHRVVENARISVPIYIKSSNDIAFKVSNIIVTALVPSPRDPSKLIPVATLVPAAEPSEPYTLGPLLPVRGPLEFQQDTIFPAVVESLMANPRGIVFKVANYNIVDEFGRDFAFTSQDIAERTAPLIFDYGGVDRDGDGISDNPERYRVAVNYGFDVAPGKRIIFDAEGKPVGASFSNVLEEVLGLTLYDESLKPTESLSAEELYNSYSTLQCSYGTILYRVRATSAIHDAGDKCTIVKGWGVIQPDGSVYPRGDLFPAQMVLKSNRGIRLAYYSDEDSDGLPDRAEYLYGCSAKNADTDGDMLDDRFEVLGARRDNNNVAIDAQGNPLAADKVWMVVLKTGDSYEARARCDAVDSDYDGLSDREEYDRKLYKRDPLTGDFIKDANGNLVLDRDFSDLLEVTKDGSGNIIGGGRTDPLEQDTDHDGISDNDEIRGYYVTLKFPIKTGAGGSKCTIPPDGDQYRVFCTSNPLASDTDGDSLNDGDEIRLSGDPTVKDNNDIGDQDNDGVTNREETEGLDVTWEGVSTTLGLPGEQLQEHAVSSATNPDTDGDGLKDAAEYTSLPPTNPAKADTDGDGLSDYAETNGVQPSAGSSTDTPYFTDPNDADSDNDGLSDGDELKGWPVRITGQSKTEIMTSDPGKFDTDLDLLPDSLEKVNATNPNESNTDGDQFELSDYDEILLGTDPKDPADICVRFTYKTTTVVKDGADADNKGMLKGDLNLSLTTIVNGVPTTEPWVISTRVSGFDSTWYYTGGPVSQGYTAVRRMKAGSYATAWHNTFAYNENGTYTNVSTNKDFVVKYEDFAADNPIITGTVSSSYLDILVESSFTAAVLSGKDINENKLEAFCRPTVSVPTVTGLGTTDAVATIRDNQFRLGTISRQIDASVPKGLVISQTPNAGTQAATQTEINILVSDGAVTVPDLTGMSYSAANVALENLGLVLGAVTQIEDPTVTTASVTAQSPAVGNIVAEGASINITLTVPPPTTP